MCRMKYLYILLLVQFISQCKINGLTNSTHFFRRDYTYIDDIEAFYKIHTIPRTWQDAKRWCSLEGASLFYPINKREADIVVNFWNRTQPIHRNIHIGISSLFVKGIFETIDGISLLDVYNIFYPGEPNNYQGKEDCIYMHNDGILKDYSCDTKAPFICKKSLATLEWNTLCDIPDRDYIYSLVTGKCYKFHLFPMNWTDAYKVCGAEQSYLAVINSKIEANYLKNLTSQAPKDQIEEKYVNGVVYLGFHNRDGRGWKTVKGTSLIDSGYAEWGNRQPDGGNNETCGSMFYNGRLNDLSCTYNSVFICEHEIGILSVFVDEKFGGQK